MTLYNYIPFGRPLEETNRVFEELLVLEKLLAAAEDRFIYTQDEKSYISLQNFILLLRNGAQPEALNRPQEGGNYLHEVLWEDCYLFITTTKEKVEFSVTVLQDQNVN